MTTVHELYELWAGTSDLEAELRRSLEPRGADWLFEAFAGLDPQPGELLVDVGARDATHAIRLARDHGLRVVALDPVPRHVELARAAVADAEAEVEVLEGAIESLPFADASVDWIWCRDVLVHVDVRSGLAECARVLVPGGRMIAYVTVATDQLEPLERAWLASALALTTLDGDGIESAASAAGLALVARTELGGEWRERMIEDGTWDASEALLELSRLRRSGAAARHGQAAADSYAAGQLWGVYQLLGKLCPTVYVWKQAG